MWRALQRVTRRNSGLDVFPLVAAKDHLRVGDGDDAIITECIRRAVDFIEGPDGVGVALLATNWVLSLDRLPRRITLPLGPVTGVVSVSWLNPEDEEVILDTSAYRLESGIDPALLLARPGAVWPVPLRQEGAVRVTFTAGYAAPEEIPGPLMQAIALLVGDFYEHREASVMGVSATEIPIGIERLLAPYRRGQIA